MEAGLDEETELELREFISGKNYFGAEELLREKQVAAKYRDALLQVTDLYGSCDALGQAKALVHNERSLEAIERLEALYEVLCCYGVEKYVSFDLGMLSKYHYYTGVIFKAYTYGVGDAIVKGGRYDTLLGRFGKNAPAIGFMVVIDDLMAALARQGIKTVIPSGAKVMEYTAETYREVLEEVKKLRTEGTRAVMMPKRKTEGRTGDQ